MPTHDDMIHEIQQRATSRGLLTHYCRTSTACRGSRGMPDLIVAGINATVFIEVKSDHGDPTPDQTTWLYTLRAGGQAAHVIRRLELRDGSLDSILAFCAGTAGE